MKWCWDDINKEERNKVESIMGVKDSLRTPEYLTLIQIAKEWAKERKMPYEDILRELITAFWRGRFDDVQVNDEAVLTEGV